MARCQPSATTRTFVEKYLRFRDARYRALAETVLGTELANGYTTVAQADRITERLALAPDDVLLDLGGGRAWPGSHVARRSGCRLVTADLPIEAVSAARPTVRALASGSAVLCADGRALPFADVTFDAVLHADVLC